MTAKLDGLLSGSPCISEYSLINDDFDDECISQLEGARAYIRQVNFYSFHIALTILELLAFNR